MRSRPFRNSELVLEAADPIPSNLGWRTTTRHSARVSCSPSYADLFGARCFSAHLGAARVHWILFRAMTWCWFLQKGVSLGYLSTMLIFLDQELLLEFLMNDQDS
jgi:hypothetical protein